MIITCWGAKGGAGTTVIAAAMALHAASSGEHGALLVDLAGDLPGVLGVAPAESSGVLDWLDLGADVPPDGLARLEVPLAAGLALLPCGSGSTRPVAVDRVEALIDALRADRRTVLVDVGCVSGPPGADRELQRQVAQLGDRSVLITRACYLALRRASLAGVVPDDVVLVAEPGRALRADDVAHALGVPVSCTVPFDPAVARAVDAGLLLARVPTSLRRAVAHG